MRRCSSKRCTAITSDLPSVVPPTYLSRLLSRPEAAASHARTASSREEARPTVIYTPASVWDQGIPVMRTSPVSESQSTSYTHPCLVTSRWIRCAVTE
jgi:hypothetical protein